MQNDKAMTIKEWTAANAGKKKKKKNPIAKLYGILKGKIMYSENAFSTTCGYSQAVRISN